MTITYTAKKRNFIFAILMISAIVGAMLQTSLSTVLPVIMSDLEITAAKAQWLTSAYSLAMGVMIPATAFLLKRFKTKNLFLVGLSLYFLGLLLCATAFSFPYLLCGRLMQALGNGIILSMTQVIILSIFPLKQRGTIMGIYGLAVGAAPVIAPTLSGMLIDYYHWHVIFWFAFAIIFIDIILAFFFMENVLENERLPFDMPSMCLSAIGFSGILLGLGNLGSHSIFSVSIAMPLVLGIASLLLFIKRQFQLDKPFLDLTTFQNREFRFAVILSIFLYAIMIAGSTLFPIYIQIIRGMSATVSGLIMMPGALAMAVISPFAGKIYDKFGIRKLALIGSAFLMFSCLGVSFVSETTPLAYLVVFYTARPVAIGCLLMPVVTWGMSTLDSEHMPHGSALITSLRTIAGAIGLAVFVALMTFATNISTGGDVTIPANVFGIDVAFASITVLAILQLLFVISFVGIEKKLPVAEEAESFV
ncbi:DHA2 family efflux MFS transporter permease subunit [Fusibacter paucivorans]|uniref:DHA2 family efflux MFS transporter permease subunit n=1 Tax=Fusibacter paucivorans TaxID=76009 RepID=A0ABS5PJE9_9FIRM|nr:DHA2 family efflux MFS transporter permease subunit [Fusibacter paucivorans]MBS7525233.1 DHA2 family efflux MFS transporter permease subunit [Fusibacter paucivorans]